MDLYDKLLLGALLVLGFLEAVMRIRLAKKQNKPLALGWKIQGFVFPAVIALAILLYFLGIDVLFPAVLVGLGQELICGLIRKRREKAQGSAGK